ncbi:MAG: lipoyl(octanoyl) transferase LipB [Chitinophagaceae bacterium]
MENGTPPQPVRFQDLGLINYQTAWDYQEDLLQENIGIKSRRRNSNPASSSPLLNLPSGEEQEETCHHLLFCEHPPVYTLGKSGLLENLLINNQQLKEKGIQFYTTNRGGDITFHGPGQLVGYPIFDLERMFTDIGKYLRYLEEVIIRTLASLGIRGERSAGETGVWMDAAIKSRARKICAMGVRCSRWVTMHGFAFNINTDLQYFNYIIPCGIADKQVTSLEKELGSRIDFQLIQDLVKKNFEEVFNIQLFPEFPHAFA